MFTFQLAAVLGLVAVGQSFSPLLAPSEATTTVSVDTNLVQSAPLYGILGQLVQDGGSASASVSSECLRDAAQLLEGINRRQIWALKTLDASGAVRNSFVWGQKAWLGSPEQCEFVNQAAPFSLSATIAKTMDDRLLEDTAPFVLQYRMVFSNFSSPMQVDSLVELHFVNRLGLCVPESCTDSEIASMTQTYWDTRRLQFQRLFAIDAHVVLVRSTSFSNFLQLPQLQWIGGSILTIALAAVALGSCECQSPFVRCFSVRENVSKLFAPAVESANTIGVISGVRVIICLWIMVFHTVFYSMFAYDNLPVLLQTMEGFAVHAVLAAVVYVDVFFVLSAILLVYNFVRNAKRIAEIRECSAAGLGGMYARMLVHRYIRLTPALFFALGLSHCVALYLQHSSAYYVDEQMDFYCTASGWWHALLYVQNLYAVSDMCTTWSWYLACDMQFYAAVLLLLFIWAKRPAAAHWLFGALLFAVLAAAFAQSWSAGVTLQMDVLLANLDVFYTRPWMRAAPYLAGCAIGAALVRLRGAKFTPAPSRVRGYWTGMALITMVTLFVTYLKSTPAWMLALAFSAGRILIAVGWGSAVLACALGFGGGGNRVLSCRVFGHLDRLTYMMYVLNPVVVGVLNAGQQEVVHFEVISTISKTIGVIVLTYVAALCTSPLFEMPFQRLSDLYVLGRKCEPRLKSEKAPA